MPEPLNPASVLTSRGPLFAATAGIRARLLAVFPATHFHHGILPAQLTRELWNSAVRSTPYVGLTWLGIAPPRENGRQFRGTASWRVLLVNTNPDPAARILGDALGLGQFAMIQAAIAALHGFTDGAADDIDGFGTLEVTEATVLTTDEWGRADQAVAGLMVTSHFALTDAEAVAELLRLRGGWQFPGSADTAAPADLNLGDA